MSNAVWRWRSTGRRFAGRHHQCRACTRLSEHTLSACTGDGPNVFRHAQVVSDGDAEDLYCSGLLDAWYWQRRLHVRLLALFVEENDFAVFRQSYLQIVGLRPCLAILQLCLSTAGIYGWNDNARVVSELDHLVAMHHWVNVCCIYYVCCQTDARTLDYASGYTLERWCLDWWYLVQCVLPLKNSVSQLYTLSGRSSWLAFSSGWHGGHYWIPYWSEEKGRLHMDWVSMLVTVCKRDIIAEVGEPVGRNAYWSLNDKVAGGVRIAGKIKWFTMILSKILGELVLWK